MRRRTASYSSGAASAAFALSSVLEWNAAIGYAAEINQTKSDILLMQFVEAVQPTFSPLNSWLEVLVQGFQKAGGLPVLNAQLQGAQVAFTNSFVLSLVFTGATFVTAGLAVFLNDDGIVDSLSRAGRRGAEMLHKTVDFGREKWHSAFGPSKRR
jgi:hypothetical protein